MFFEATYVPSPPISIASIDEEEVDPFNDMSNEQQQQQQQQQQQETDIEPTSDKPVDHLIFVIHGIGQQTEQYGHFYEHIENLQETTRQVLQAKVPDHNVRIELIPIEWHRHIHEQVDPIINKITLKSIPTIRLIENDYLADVLFYFSKDRGQTIINNVTHLFNTSYHNFMEKHPNFDGKIVIMGYSLGGIIVWDILSHQREPINEEEQNMYNKLDIQFSKLDFKPHFFFGLGSPVGAVLTFRGQDPTLYHPDFDIQFENVFHPFDPLGYRFEPLFNNYYTDKPAVLVERSVPIGPSFSFPSMPSFPLSAGFLSFFSWKQNGVVAAKTLYNATSDAAAAAAAPASVDDNNNDETNNKEQQQQQQHVTSPAADKEESGFMSTLMSYFSKGGGTTTNHHKKRSSLKGQQEEKEEDDIGEVITWDPIKEQTREQLLALRDDLDRTLNNTCMDNLLQPKRPSINMRSKTFTYQNDAFVGGGFSTSLEQNSDGSVMMLDNNKTSGFALTNSKSHSTTATCNTTASSSSSSSITTVDPPVVKENKMKRIPLRKTMTEQHLAPLQQQQQQKIHHLVEVLGIDGIRVDLFPPSFDSSVTTATATTTNQQTQDDQVTNNNNNADGESNLWLDLDKELHKPGPAITSSGESRADVAQEATVPKSSSHDQEEINKQQQQQKEANELAKLPGKCRMDYVLQPDSVMSMIANEYLIGLRAHFSYWTNKDLLWHMLRRIEDLDNVSTSGGLEDELKNKSQASLASLSGSSSTTTTSAVPPAIVSVDDTNIAKKK